MGFISGRSSASNDWSPLDDRWYQPFGFQSDAGIAVSAQTILNCGAVLAAVRFKAQSFGLCSPKVYAETTVDGKTSRNEDRQHYLFRLLRRPNKWQTGFTWRTHAAFNAILHGNAYNKIVASDRTFAGELRPLQPERTRVVDQTSDGSLIYEYSPLTPGQPRERLSQSEVLHFRDLSSNGYTGLVTYTLLRNIAGIALSAEKHASLFMKQGARIGGVLASKTTLADSVRKTAEDNLQKAWGGPDAEGKIVLLGADFDFKAVTLDHQKSQFLELRDFQVEEVLRALGVPGVVVGYSKNLMGYASADAFFEKGGIKHCLLPMVENFEDEIDYALLPNGDAHYCKFSLATLLRASTKDEWELLIKAAGRPIITGNEARGIIDRNPDPDPSMDKVLLPANMMTVGDDPERPGPGEPTLPEPGRRAPKKMPTPEEPADDTSARQAAEIAAAARRIEEERARAEAAERSLADLRQESEAIASRSHEIAVQAAGRVVRRELAAIVGREGEIGMAKKHAKDPDEFRQRVRAFYAGHADFVAVNLGLSARIAERYCEQQEAELLERGVAACQAWEAERVPKLAELAVGQRPSGTHLTVVVQAPSHQEPAVTNVINVPQQAPAAVNVSVPKDAIKVESVSTVKLEAPGPQKMEITAMPGLRVVEVPATKTTVTRRTKTGGIEQTKQEQD